MDSMIPDFVHPIYGKTVQTLLNNVLSQQACDDWPMLKVLPFPRYPCATTPTPCGLTSVPSTAKYWTIASTDSKGRPGPPKSHILATLPVTPDSFSDGSIRAAVEYVATSVESGGDIISIGGYSTRPGAESVSQNEIDQAVPIIRAIRAQDNESVREALISIDTFRSEVAEAAVLAGANCINGLYTFIGPGYPPIQAATDHLLKMRDVARRLCVPVILMHSQLEAGSDKKYGEYDENLVSAIQTELGNKIDAIVRGEGGVRRWFVIVDRGSGPVDTQYALLRSVASVTAD